ncbi:hypothetical protein ACLB2K_006166 [Fragaria x ananassa]
MKTKPSSDPEGISRAAQNPTPTRNRRFYPNGVCGGHGFLLRKGVTDTVMSLSRRIDVNGVATEPCRNKEANCQITFKTSCLAEHFTMTMSFLSAENASTGAGNGLGSLNSLHCTKFQRTEVGLEVVPLMFLQLVYLDVVRNNMIFKKKLLKPVMTWEIIDVKRVVDTVKGLGGWESTKVFVSKRHMWDEQSENIGSFDKSTRMKTSVVEDLSDVRLKFSVVKWEVSLVRSAVRQLEPDIGRLRGTVTTLDTSLNRLEDGGLSQIVSDAAMRVLEVNQNSSSGRTNSHFN